MIQRKQWYSRSLNHNSVTKINTFDYGPLYNQQLTFEEKDSSETSGLPKIGSEVTSTIGVLQARSSTDQTISNDNRATSQSLFGKYQVIEDKDRLEFDLQKHNKQKQTINRDRSMNDFLKNE